jgi:hypothetical protein
MSSVYDEAHHEVLIYGGFTLHGKVEQAQVICGRGTVRAGVSSAIPGYPRSLR